VSGLRKGAYTLADAKPGTPEIILMGTGSEGFALRRGVYERLAAEGVAARVVSMPSWELFREAGRRLQGLRAAAELHPASAVEQASALGWERFTGLRGTIIAMKKRSAPRPRSRSSWSNSGSPEKTVYCGCPRRSSPARSRTRWPIPLKQLGEYGQVAMARLRQPRPVEERPARQDDRRGRA